MRTRKELATALFSLGNFIGGSLLIGQVFGEIGFHWQFSLLGLVFLTAVYYSAITILEKDA